jgi:molybdenum-dependent DNA-binding transcriptional regulator ModE
MSDNLKVQRVAGKTITKKRNRNKNTNDDISNEKRKALLDMILSTKSIRNSAKALGINNSTAKSIYYKYKETG